MNDKIMSLSRSTRELRIERNAADAQRFELTLLIARLTQRDKRSAGMLLNIMSAHETARSNIRNQVIVDTLIATEMAPDFPAPKQEVPLKRECLDPASSEYAYKPKV